MPESTALLIPIAYTIVRTHKALHSCLSLTSSKGAKYGIGSEGMIGALFLPSGFGNFGTPPRSFWMSDPIHMSSWGLNFWAYLRYGGATGKGRAQRCMGPRRSASCCVARGTRPYTRLCHAGWLRHDVRRRDGRSGDQPRVPVHQWRRRKSSLGHLWH